MNKVTLKTSTPLKHILLRFASFLLGKKLNSLLKKLLIFGNKKSEIYFKRTIVIEDKCVKITDFIKSPYNIKLEKASNFSLRLVASGKFSMGSDLLHQKKDFGTSKEFQIQQVVDI